MSCKSYQGQMESFLHGELTAVGQKKLELHLEQCARCRVELARTARTIHFLRVGFSEITGGFKDKGLPFSGIGLPKPQPLPVWPRLVPVGLLAALILTLALFPSWGNPLPPRADISHSAGSESLAGDSAGQKSPVLLQSQSPLKGAVDIRIAYN